ncbi:MULTISPECIES: rhomboid family intramembrane serine protease [Reichenbachiella]|uniref:Rhomboid family protein n=1 Tax=Reichenbachiella agariperforans TaxID=156994 RepID=A0A1M6TYK8_REIAG|nr:MULTISPECIES: rhomboid family intramembrane serine protease [Reichenbachiella]MBU2915626.1 rhomboid family intramembrane serine protease [Reichenbachiella agariperforans]RJE71310.1 hypothetical protein BGP76_04220 [Reichenbachiella sp. MSK19-1]SHK62019.1 Rhomboid family protein [Reichenbachiella agariperforans]
MENIDTREEKYNKNWVPYQWPWKNRYGENMTSFKEWLWSRKFSIGYLIIVWVLLGIFGFAARRNCDGPWEIQFMCEMTMWMGQFKSDFWHFMLTCFTTPWFHNDFVHILFVTIFGFFFPVQSYEEQHGTWSTIKIYFASYVFIGLFTGSLFNTLLVYFPDVVFITKGFTRAWMGGSVGVFAIIGALSYYSSKKWFLWSMVFVFEIFNMSVLGNNSHISFIHISCATFGWVYTWVGDRYGFKSPRNAMRL